MAVVHPYRFTVEDYERMGRAGVFHEDDRVELIEGQIVEMTPIGPPHAGTVNALNRIFSRAVGDDGIVSVQNPTILSDITEPQPDLLVLRPRDDLYRTTHPRPDDVLLLVEVADSSIAYDRSVKAPLYARAGIAEYWLVDLRSRVLEVHREPTPEGYVQVLEMAPGTSVAPVAFPDVGIDVGEILGPD